MLFISMIASSGVTGFAQNEHVENNESVEKYATHNTEGENIGDYFKNKTIAQCKYLYSFDDNADYIYVEFVNDGYAIFSSITMELMEYSLHGKLPYSYLSDKEYYAGPLNYYEKVNSKFVNLGTGEQVDLSTIEAISFSSHMREYAQSKTTYRSNFDVEYNNEELEKNINTYLGIQIGSTNYKSSSPEVDEDNLIIPEELTGTLISNYKYFIINPIHGENALGPYANNNTGTCGPVASQLLLSYNNYFNDRRIIENKFLHGYNISTNTITVPNQNPNYCDDPMSMTTRTTGTKSGDTGEFSYYVKVIESMMEPNSRGCSLEDAKTGITSLLNERIPTSGYSIHSEENDGLSGWFPINSSPIKNEINEGRPVLISTGENLGATNHVAICYGYQNYTYPNNAGTYEGYIVHNGHAEDTQVWINSMWCKGYLSLKINHTHDYNTVGAISGTTRTEYKCSICGHRTDAAINMKSNTKYSECVISLPQNEYTYKDIYVKFPTQGTRLFQTFGTKDVKMYLYDEEYNQLAYNDDNGSSFNSLFSYTVAANTPYILRIKLYNTDDLLGDVKIGVTPADACSTITNYESIWNYSGTSAQYAFSTISAKTSIMTFTPTQGGTYTFDLKYVGDTQVDTYLYLIDPYSTAVCLYDDDSGENSQARITATLVANRRYFLVASPYVLSTTEKFLLLDVKKIS